jgi:lipopolysaccharide/colanic/teichoic acid biosynthesis glycosyltransferase
VRLKAYIIFKRIFDIFLSLLGVILLSPLFALISICIISDSKGGIFFVQKRVGQNGREFRLIKFRTMHTGSELQGKLTMGNRDHRITRMGKILRKFKMDELPQLFNVITGRMSLVGPRPEVMDHVVHYNSEQMRVLDVKPGLTDYGSLKFIHESDLLDESDRPEKLYMERILPEKLRLNLEYIRKRNLATDIIIIFKTISRIIRTIHFEDGKK